MKKMKIEIWSDVMCPFCYIGKRRFEQALEKWDQKNNVEIEWKSFQLNPDMKNDTGKSVDEYLAEIKGMSVAQAKSLNDRVSSMAAECGLNYHLDKAVPANSFDAHRFSHFAKSKGKGIDAEEVLFKAYFTDGKNIADHATLIELGEKIGLNKKDISEVLLSNQYAKDVTEDVNEAARLGIHAVPCFVFNRSFGISGAQDESVFIQALEKAKAS